MLLAYYAKSEDLCDRQKWTEEVVRSEERNKKNHEKKLLPTNR
jgi:hypothetical protein